MMWTRPRLIALIAAGAVLGLGFAFAAGWFAHQEYVAWRLSQVFSEGPFASDSSDSSSSETASKGDIEDPNKEYSPSESDCPSARILGKTTQKSGPSRTKYFDTPTGQLLAHWVYPDAPTGIVQRLAVDAESGDAEGGPVMAGPTFDFDLPKNQGVSKIENTPGRYRFAFDPKQNELEYLVTVYECDPSGGEARSQP
jgi:hypothetical protein